MVDLNKTVVWMASISPLISNLSRTHTKSLGIVPNAPIITAIIVTLMFYWFLSTRTRFNYLFHFSFSSIFTLDVPFSLMVEFQFLAQFPVDHLPQPVVSSLMGLIISSLSPHNLHFLLSEWFLHFSSNYTVNSFSFIFFSFVFHSLSFQMHSQGRKIWTNKNDSNN